MSKTVHYRACHLCEAICGLALEVTADEGQAPRISSIKGDPLDTFSRGHICPKGNAILDLENDPDRLRKPMRRIGEAWQEISWDEAFTYAGEKLAAIQNQFGNNSSVRWKLGNGKFYKFLH